MTASVSSAFKKVLLTLVLILLLLVVCNDLIMPWYVKHGGETTVPSVAGLKLEAARRSLDSLGLIAKEGDRRADKNYPDGTVINQIPNAGRKVNKGRHVYLTISSGEQQVVVPNLKGRTLRDAKFQLERQELKLGAVEYLPSNEFPENTVIEQKTSPGIKVKKEVYISVIVSRGKITDKVMVPNLNGKTLAQSQQILASRGLKLGNITYQHIENLLPNTIVDQFPRAGELVAPDLAVDVFVVQKGEKKRDVLEN